MIERPLSLGKFRVLAILGGATELRLRVRTEWPEGATSAGRVCATGKPEDGDWWWLGGDPRDCETWDVLGDTFRCYIGEPGEFLWIRERYQIPHLKSDSPFHAVFPKQTPVRYLADGEMRGPTYAGKWGKPQRPLTMHRARSRINIEVVDLHVERLHEIDDAGIRREIFPQGGCDSSDDLRALYREYWESSEGPGDWDKNPFVWVRKINTIKLAEAGA